MAPTFPFRCDVCCLSVNSYEQLTQHFNGSRHKRNETKKEQAPGPVVTKPSDYFVSSGFVGGNSQAAQSQIENSRFISQGENQQQKTVANINSQSYCTTCRVQLTSPSQAEMHYKGGKHRQKMKLLEENALGLHEEDGSSAKKAKFEFCEVCNVKLLSPAVAEPHYSGDKHRKKVRLLSSRGLNADGCGGTVQPGAAPAATVSSLPIQNERANPGTGQAKLPSFFCSFCGISVNSQSQMEAHRTGNKHKMNVQKCISPQTTASSVSSPITYSEPVQNYSTYQYQSVNYSVSGQYVTQY